MLQTCVIVRVQVEVEDTRQFMQTHHRVEVPKYLGNVHVQIEVEVLSPTAHVDREHLPKGGVGVIRALTLA